MLDRATRLHDYPVVAPFKRAPRDPSRPGPRGSLHDYPVVAPFKLAFRAVPPTPAAESPRLSSRGPIQAPHASPVFPQTTSLHDYPVVAPFKPTRPTVICSAAAVASPRLSSRGPIQASTACAWSPSSDESPRLSSRGPIQARHRANDCRAWPVSTTIQSWPHSSDDFGIVRHGASPGLHDYPVVAPFKLYVWTVGVSSRS